MKNYIRTALIIFTICILLAGCGENYLKKYNDLKAAYDTLKTEHENLKKEYSELEKKYIEVKGETDIIFE